MLLLQKDGKVLLAHPLFPPRMVTIGQRHLPIPGHPKECFSRPPVPGDWHPGWGGTSIDATSRVDCLMVRLMQFSKKISFQTPKGSYIPETFKYLFMNRKSFHVCILGYPFGMFLSGFGMQFYWKFFFGARFGHDKGIWDYPSSCSVCWEGLF